MAGAPFGVYGGRPTVLATMRGLPDGPLSIASGVPSLAGAVPADAVDVTGRGVLAEGPQTDAKVYRLDKWGKRSHRQRVQTLRRIADEYGRDPRLALYAVHNILEPAGVVPRDWPAMSAALLRHVQDYIHYVNEKGERLQSPWRTLQWKIGDCDDQSLLLAALATSLDLPNRFVLQGRIRNGAGKSRLVRWIEGTPAPPAWMKANGPVEWFHITVQLGWPNGSPAVWASAEPTLRGAPLGYELVKDGIDMDEHGRPSVPGTGRKVPGYSEAPAGLRGASGGGGMPASGGNGGRLLGLSGLRGGPGPLGSLQGPGSVDVQVQRKPDPEKPAAEEEPPFWQSLRTKSFWNKAALGAVEFGASSVLVYFLMKRVEAWDRKRGRRR